uniref:tRNA(fMet)-specific endonuclease VapC n=1 Tax=Candidatus Kentrum sp. SD TaxID=2126332 RepID=A0A451BNI0_9GAMM|nr:MAG: tRNA(fMet)-specific endonuclease VapC [Candidatus Kentron sp. SD]
MFFRKHPQVTARFADYLARYKKIDLSIITYYEIISGLAHLDAHKKTAAFLEFVSMNRVLPLTERSVTLSAGIYADLRKVGKPLDDIDLLIAGVAMANNRVLVTHNRSHFERIEGLEIEDWRSRIGARNNLPGDKGMRRVCRKLTVRKRGKNEKRHV